MKKHVILFGILGLILGFSLQAQILTKYTTGFESGSPINYTLTGGNTYSTTIYSGGSRALLLQQTTGEDAILLLDTIDLSQSAPSLQYATLEFMHICKVRSLSTMSPTPQGTYNAPPSGAIIEVKRIDESNWTQLRSSQYDMTWGGGTQDFSLNGFFSDYSYSVEWNGGNNTTPNNTMWKKERFNLGSLFSSALPANRKLLIRFRLPKAAAPNDVDSRAIYYGWLLDNITVNASPSSLVPPSIKMIEYPVQANTVPARHPFSRDVVIKANISTTVAQGLDNDSVYIIYKLGNEPYGRVNMVREGTSDIWCGRIPFCGYDTIVSFRVVAKDATSNHNTATFPSNESSYSYYSCIRGVNVETSLGESTSTSSLHPFGREGDLRSEYVYDKAILEAAGYTHGAISRMQFRLAGGGGTMLNNFTIKMQNVDVTHTTGTKFSTVDLKTVYSGSFMLPAGSGTIATIDFIDTFYYSGNDILMQICYDNNADGSATTLNMFPTATDKASLYIPLSAPYGLNACIYEDGTADNKRPLFTFKMNKNLPLMKDLGVESVIMPSLSTAANTPTAIQVSLRNMGVTTINGVTIYYTIDGGEPQSYQWTGALPGQTSIPVIITTTAQFTPGFKKVVAWVGDTLQIGGNSYIDHEPFNDTTGTTFISCAGPMSGVRYVGGQTPDYDNIDELFEALYRCGVNGPLTVKLPAGTYHRLITLPSIQGVSSTNIVTFEPMEGPGTVTITTPSQGTCALDLQNTSYVRFKNINFTSTPNTSVPYIVSLGVNSTGCIFDSCIFADSTILGLTSLLFTGGANDFTVDHCIFKGGVVSLNLMGAASDNCASNNRVYRSYFEMAKESCIRATNQIAVIIDSNYLNNTQTNPSFVLMLQSCYGASKVLNNKIYSSNGASCFGATDFNGNASVYAIVANNMFVTESSTDQTVYTPVNIMNTEKMKYVYNTSKINVSTSSNISSATIGGSGATDIYIMNNIFVSMTENNYALNFIPSNNNYVIDHNLYYTPGSVLNRYISDQTTTLTAWKTLLHTESGVYLDTNSLFGRPVFLDITELDLRTLSLIIQNAGTPIPEVTTDMFGTVRDTVSPCIGAYESAPLYNNLAIDEVLSPQTSCTLGTENVEVVLKNYGYATIPAGSAIFYYTKDGLGQVDQTIDRAIESMDTIHFRITTDENLTAALSDRDYEFKMWTSLSTDDDRSNDTIIHIVSSLYQLQAPSVPPIVIPYNTATQISISGATGVVYWYENDTTETAFYRGQPFQTDTMYRDTTFYVSQRADVEMLKITEVQYNKSKPGVTTPYPSFMARNTNIAVELSNVGNYPINIAGDSLIMVGSGAYNNKKVVLPNVIIQPGKSFVVQYVRGDVSNSQTYYAPYSLSAISGTSTNVGIIYKDGDVVKDAVVLNTTPSTWAAMGVPPSIWTGNNPLTANTAGIRRVNLNSNSASGWVVCNANPNLMSLGTIESNLLQYHDNGCLGYRSSVQIDVQNIPAINLGVVDVEVSNEGCGLYDESISLELRNLGTGSVTKPILYFSVNDSIYSPDTIYQNLGSFASISHTFTTLADLRSYNQNRYYDVKVWVDAIEGDMYRDNDTARLIVESFYTPDIPIVDTIWTTEYGTADTLFSNLPLMDTLAWYDTNGNLLHIGNTYTTDLLYVNTDYEVRAKGIIYEDVHLGELQSSSNTVSYAPYDTKFKYNKEQYIIKAKELVAMGYRKGIIQTLGFYLDSVRIASGEAIYQEYSISMGTTIDSLFANKNAWKDVSLVYYRTDDTIRNSQKGWITHVLDSAFYWDGQSNIVIQVCFSLYQQGGNVSTRYTNAFTNSVLYIDNNIVYQCDTLMSGTLTNKRPDIKFGFVGYACESQGRNVIVNLTNVPQVDVSPLGILSLMPTGNYSGVPTPLTVTLTNYGTNTVGAQTGGVPGTGTQDSLIISWALDGVHMQDTLYSGLLGQGEIDTITITNYSFTPGTHCIQIYLTHIRDNYQTNDTIEGCFLFCFPAGIQHIGPNGDYLNFTDAITSLINAGICGPVVFEVASGTYNEQVVIPAINGLDSINTITFRSATGNAEDVIVTYAPTATENYVVKFDSTHNIFFEDITVYSTTSIAKPNNTTPATVLVIDNCMDMTFVGNIFKVQSGKLSNSTNANAVVLRRSVVGLEFENNIFDTCYIGLLNITDELSDNTADILIRGNTFKNFTSKGISFRRVSNIDIIKNRFHSGSSSNGVPLTGIYLAEHYGTFDVLQNVVNLVDDKNGLKKGIHIGAVTGSPIDPCRLYNNMVSIVGKGSGSVKSSGIYIDSSSYINVYFNTTRVQAGTNALKSSGAEIATSSEIVMKNNLLSNFSKGYAYYVENQSCVSVSDFNNYYSNNPDSARKFVYWGRDIISLSDLVALTSKDVSSVEIKPYFLSTTDLHLSSGTMVGKAEYLTDVTIDIDDTIRTSIPRPSIGAHEYIRPTHDLAVMEILTPVLLTESNIGLVDSTTDLVESDSLLVIVRIINNGASLETSGYWDAYIAGTPLQSISVPLPAMNPQDIVETSVYIPMVLGVLDTQTVVAQVYCDGDNVYPNDTVSNKCFLDEAYNFEATETTVVTGDGCRLYNAPVTVTVKNVGRKEIPTTFPIVVGYQATFKSQSSSTESPVTLPTVPLQEIKYLTQPLQVNTTTDIAISQPVDIYPHGLTKDIKVNIRSWANLQNDVKQMNDTTPNLTVDSYHTPVTPIGQDTVIPYATLVTLNASQSQNRPLRWHVDSLSAPFYEPTNYNVSKKYLMEHIIFSDTLYYLSSISSSGCTSYYDPIYVTLRPPVAIDAAPKFIEEPVDKVYMSRDTVKIRLINYGTQAISNIPITYKKHRASNAVLELQEVTEICTETIQPGAEYVYSFDSLVDFEIVSGFQNYTLTIWTDLATEQTRENDTIKKVIAPISENSYCKPTVSTISGMDISSVRLGMLGSNIHPIGHGYMNLVDYTTPKIPTLSLYKNLTDTLFITAVDNQAYESGKWGFVRAYIDWNRDGLFNDTSEVVMVSDTILSGATAEGIFTVPSDAYYGHTRMRIILNSKLDQGYIPLNDTLAFPKEGICPKVPEGVVYDYLVNVRKPLPTNPALVRVVNPVDGIIDRHDTIKTVQLLLANYGENPISDVVLNYTYSTDSIVYTLPWNGFLNSMECQVINLPEHIFSEGTTIFNAWIESLNDEDSTDNYLTKEFHRYHVIQLHYSDDLEGISTKMYAPSGTTQYDRNYWEIGTPIKNRISSAKSGVNAIVTSLNSSVDCGNNYGNRSILYTPILNIGQIKPDTLSFWMVRNIPEGAYLRVEYLNYMDKWKTLGGINDVVTDSWYNDEGMFTGNSAGYSYEKCWYPLTAISSDGDFAQYTQLRFIMMFPEECGSGDGIAIDDIEIQRARRAVDVGVVDLPYPIEPKFGQTISPKIVIKNYGLDTIKSVTVAYHPHGSALPKREVWTGVLAPDDTITYQFSESSAFTIEKTFPDTFGICAYTISEQDLYWDNDSTCMEFYLSPLQIDAGMGEIVYPSGEVIAGDSLYVTLRVRNYGETPLETMPVGYSFNGQDFVYETIDFMSALGRPLGTFEYYEYTFEQKIRTVMGVMEIAGSTFLPSDEYIYNDSLHSRIYGISAVADIKPIEIVTTESFNDVYVGLKIANIGSLGVNDFEVSFYYDNDTNTLEREVFHREGMPVPALDTVIYVFNKVLDRSNRTAPYDVFRAFVHYQYDVDNTNDTVTTVVPSYTDMRADTVLVEENENAECRVRLMVTNVGTSVVGGNSDVNVRVTVNGTSLSGSRREIMLPDQTYEIDLNGTVAKNPDRYYEGTGRVIAANDVVSDNNETSVVLAVDYFGITNIVEETIVLEQNYPNPFSNKTTIDFSIPMSGNVRFFVVNTLGRLIYQTDEFYTEGRHSIDFSYSNLTTGIYYYGIEFNGKRLMKKMIFRK